MGDTLGEKVAGLRLAQRVVIRGGVSVLGAIQHLAAQALMQPALLSLALGMKLD